MGGTSRVPIVRGRTEAMRGETMAFRRCVGVLAVLVLGACEPQATEPRGAAGESCTARSDCEAGLICLDNRCLSAKPSSSGGEDAGTAEAPDTRGAAGESCARRADCGSGLLCIAQVCVESSQSSMPMRATLGERGESCQAANDCQPNLACIMNRCVTAESSIAVQAKQCFRVQCELDEDCCKNFVAPLNCPMWKMSCSAGDTAACASFNASCMCSLQCQNSLCAAVRKCSVDSDCAVATERCFAGACAQCATDGDCKMSGQRCVSSICRAGCDRNEQCPLFFECKSGECSEVGCKSDRECYFSTKNSLARCVEKKCATPCTSDAQCPDLQVCRDSRCAFVGCESNEECRVLLNLAGQPGNDRAVCRLPDRT